MAVKPEFETYDRTGVVAKCRAQSVVECRLSGVGEISAVLATQANVAATGASAGDGEAKYNGKLFLGVIYEDAEKNLCRMERGVEFSHHAEEEHITPACNIRVALSVLSTTVRREGASLYVSCVVEAEIVACGVRAERFLVGGEELICRTEEQTFLKEEYCGGALELNDEFDCETVTDILMHGEAVSVQRVACEAGSVIVSGEAAVNICVLRQDGAGNYERLLPFRAELPCDGASVGGECEAWVEIRSANVTLTADEEGGRSKIALTLSLSAQGVAFAREGKVVACDAFSPHERLELTTERGKAEYRKDGIFFTERIGGVASLSAPIDYSCALQALVLQKAECDCRADGAELQGVASAVLIVAESDGTHRSIEVQLPFAIPLKTDVAGRKTANAMVCGMSVRQKREGEIEADATLKIAVEIYVEAENEYISDVQIGEEILESDSAFSIFLPREGDSLWSIAKVLRKPPEEVSADNPDLTFPVRRGERIIVYRQKE
jgi:hypothetical protein